ncbi:MAG: RNHCP domain-containing protein [Anaerolineaceae bacterium]|nr:RNHCP domain-containing protein [Anaerolineaceae bacterium]
MKHKHNTRFNEEEFLDAAFEKRNKYTFHKWDDRAREEPHRDGKVYEKGFSCAQCGFSVTTSREQSGVNNRNHCPRCVWSKHVDEIKAGDRKADCKSRMQPIGLTLKQTPKRYNREAAGELMLIHRCTGCGKLSINRIAADDDAGMIYQVFNRSMALTAKWKELLKNEGIRLLGSTDLTVVYSQLFGWQSILEEFEPHGMLVDESSLIPFEPESELVSVK